MRRRAQRRSAHVSISYTKVRPPGMGRPGAANEAERAVNAGPPAGPLAVAAGITAEVEGLRDRLAMRPGRFDVNQPMMAVSLGHQRTERPVPDTVALGSPGRRRRQRRRDYQWEGAFNHSKAWLARPSLPIARDIQAVVQGREQRAHSNQRMQTNEVVVVKAERRLLVTRTPRCVQPPKACLRRRFIPAVQNKESRLRLGCLSRFGFKL